MKVLFVGLGSIGRRHARLLSEVIDCEIYAFRSDSISSFNIPEVKSLYIWDDVLIVSPDVAFITNPTSFHIETAIKCTEIGCSLFIEKPIDCKTVSLRDLLEIVGKNNISTYIAYNLRFHPIIRKLRKLAKLNKPLHFRASCCSYLPDWRPGQDHKSSYSSKKELGGGVLLDLSHELDYAGYILDSEVILDKKSGRITDITIDTDDFSDIRFSSDRCQGSIHLNYFSHNFKRQIEIDYEEESIVADLIKNTIDYFECGELINTEKYKVDIDYTYKEQLKYYFSNIDNTRMMNNLFDASKLFYEILK